MAEGGPAAAVADGGPQRSLGSAGAPRPQLEAAEVQGVERDLVALADLAQEVLAGDHRIREDQGPRGAALDAGLLLLRAQAHARRSLLDHEGGEVLAVDLGEGDVDVGEAGVAEPHLLAVEDPALAVRREDRPRLRVHRVARRGRLGERVGADPLSGREAGQVLLLLRLGAEVDDGQRADAGVAHEGDREAAVAGRLLRDEAAAHLVEAEAAVLLRDLDAQQPQLARLAQERPGGLVLQGEDLGDPRHHLLLHELGGRVADHALLLAQVLGGEDLLHSALLDEEAASPRGEDRCVRLGGHHQLFSLLSREGRGGEGRDEGPCRTRSTASRASAQ